MTSESAVETAGGFWSRITAPNAPWAQLGIGDLARLSEILDERPTSLPQTRIVEGSRCWNTNALFREWASVLQFPEYFGGNWNAFDDCLRDLRGLNGEAIIVVVRDFEQVLADDPHGEFNVFAESLKDASGRWIKDWPEGFKRGGYLRFALLCSTTGAVRTLSRLKSADIDIAAIRLTRLTQSNDA